MIFSSKKYSLLVLAGGKSSRMGFNKAFAKWNGKEFISIIIEALSPLAKEVIISGEKVIFERLPYKIVPDETPNCGAVGGLQAGLKSAQNDTCIVTACDTPFIPKKLMEYLLHQDFNDCIVVKENNQTHPLIGIYRKSCLPKINEAIARNQYALHRLLQNLETKYFDITTNPVFAGKGYLRNINNFAELEALRNENRD